MGQVGGATLRICYVRGSGMERKAFYTENLQRAVVSGGQGEEEGWVGSVMVLLPR